MKKHVKKPWGYEDIWAICDHYAAKILFIEKGSRLSRQYHTVKEETILVINGSLLLEIGENKDKEFLHLEVGDSYHITPGTIHRFCADKDDVKLVEVSTVQLDDVVRISDDFGRETKAIDESISDCVEEYEEEIELHKTYGGD